MTILLAAASAAVWGVSDFSGGKASQRFPALGVTTASKLAATPPLAILLLAAWTPPRLEAVAWGLPAGLVGATGIVLLYRGLASGAMSVFAPISAVTAAVVPLLVGLAVDRPPSGLALIGAGCAVVAIGLVSFERRREHAVVTPGLVGLALLTGFCFGVFFSLLRGAGTHAGLWPLASAHVGALVLLVLLAWRRRQSVALRGRVLALALAAGALDVCANALYLVAVQHGSLAIVAPVASLYPASTVLLALAVDRERVRAVQVAGLGLAAASLALVAT